MHAQANAQQSFHLVISIAEDLPQTQNVHLVRVGTAAVHDFLTSPRMCDALDLWSPLGKRLAELVASGTRESVPPEVRQRVGGSSPPSSMQP